MALWLDHAKRTSLPLVHQKNVPMEHPSAPRLQPAPPLPTALSEAGARSSVAGLHAPQRISKNTKCVISPSGVLITKCGFGDIRCGACKQKIVPKIEKQNAIPTKKKEATADTVTSRLTLLPPEDDRTGLLPRWQRDQKHKISQNYEKIDFLPPS